MATAPRRSTKAYAGRTLVHEVGSGKSYRTSVIFAPRHADMLVSLANANGITLTAVFDAILDRVSFDDEGRAVVRGGMLEGMSPVDTQLAFDADTGGTQQPHAEIPTQGAA